MNQIRRAMMHISLNNRSNKIIDKLGVTYDGAGIQMFSFKDVMPKEIKEIEIPTEYIRNETIVRIYTDDGHVYKIKEKVKNNEDIIISIDLKDINKDGSLEFEVK